MLRIPYIILAVFIFGQLSAQKIYHQENIGWKAKNMELLAIHDSANNQHVVFLVNGDSIRVYLLNRNDAVVRVFSFSRSDGEKVLGGFIDQRKIYLFSENGKPGMFLNYILNTEDGSVTQHFIGSELKNETVINHINSGNHFLYFTINKKTSEFSVYNWHNPANVDTIRFPFNNKNTWQDIFSTQGRFFIPTGTTSVGETGVLDIHTAGSLNKLYFIHDTLLLVLNNNIGITKVYTFDIKGEKFSYREIKNDSVRKKYLQVSAEHGTKFIVDEEYADNTFLKDGKLYFVSAKTDRLFISITDFYSGSLLQKFSVEKDGPIDFKNTPIIQEGSDYLPNDKRELTRTKQLLKKMLKTNAFIGVVTDSTRMALTIGAWEQELAGGGGSGISNSQFTGVPGSMVSVPYRNDYVSPWTGAAYFRMQLDSQSLSYIPGPMQTSIHDRVEEFTKNIKTGGVECLYKQDGHFIYIYYDKKLRSLVFTRF